MSLTFRYHTSADTNHNSFSKDFLKQSKSAFEKIINNPQYGFFHLTDRFEYIASAQKIAQKHMDKKHFVQVGIGGSALGPQMLVSSLGKRSHCSFHLLDNVDSDYVADIFDQINIQDALFYVVSKSGGTAETIACYSIARNLLKQAGIPEEEFSRYFVFCTDKENGQLREHVDQNNYDSLIVPSDVGGRFSVLTHVGLFPALFFGIDIDKLYTGANEFKAQLLDENVAANPLLQNAAHIAYLYIEKDPKVNQTVLMPYSSKLKDFSFWFVQLWAESLGKWSKEKNKSMGLTPIPAYGATDQHSQMQLFMEGPNDKLMYMLHVSKKQNNFPLDSGLKLASAQKLEKYDLNDLMQAEYNGSVRALIENQRNVIEVEMDCLNEENLGALILFFESLTALMGHYLFVDPFDQPGVEKGKKYAFEYLNSL